MEMTFFAKSLKFDCDENGLAKQLQQQNWRSCLSNKINIILLLLPFTEIRDFLK